MKAVRRIWSIVRGAVLGLIVLLFQAVLLAHGGLTTLGSNTFSMAIAGPFASFGVYRLCRKLKLSRALSAGIACGVGDLFTYCVTSEAGGKHFVAGGTLSQEVQP